MTRRYTYRQLMMILTSDRWFVMREGERYFFAQIVD